MATFFALSLPLIGCAVMMAVCARMMRRGDCRTQTDAGSESTELTELRSEVAALRARLARDTASDRDTQPT